MIAFLRPVSVVALRGGFGNQLFAWAYGQGLKNSGHYVLYDRGERLGRGFALEGLISKSKLIHLPAFFWRRVSRSESTSFFRVNRFLNLEDQHVPPELTIRNPRIFSLHWGYWQSLDYFSKSKQQIFEQVARWLGTESERNQTCAIHVRRGDYISDPSAAAIMGSLPLSYYKQAIPLMKQKGYSKFVVYSDDRTWVAENILALDEAIRVAETAEADDFVHMSMSGALITANSSFSWWAAFLVSMSGGDVVAPKKWFAEPNLDSSRIVPESWISI